MFSPNGYGCAKNLMRGAMIFYCECSNVIIDVVIRVI